MLLKNPGKVKCQEKINGPAYCDIACAEYAQYEEVPLQRYQCDDESFGEDLPYCVSLSNHSTYFYNANARVFLISDTQKVIWSFWKWFSELIFTQYAVLFPRVRLYWTFGYNSSSKFSWLEFFLVKRSVSFFSHISWQIVQTLFNIRETPRNF